MARRLERSDCKRQRKHTERDATGVVRERELHESSGDDNTMVYRECPALHPSLRAAIHLSAAWSAGGVSILDAWMLEF